MTKRLARNEGGLMKKTMEYYAWASGTVCISTAAARC